MASHSSVARSIAEGTRRSPCLGLQIFTKRIKQGVWDIRAVVDSGGMPSSHSALCTVGYALNRLDHDVCLASLASCAAPDQQCIKMQGSVLGQKQQHES